MTPIARQDFASTVVVAGQSICTTHLSGEEYGVWLVPLVLYAPMRARRFNACVGRLTAGTGGWAMALYRLPSQPIRDRGNPTSGIQPEAYFVRTIGGFQSTGRHESFETTMVTDQDLDPSRGIVMIGFQSAAVSDGWLAATGPENVLGHRARKTRPLGAALGDFPAILRMLPTVEGAPVPRIECRSPEWVLAEGA